MHELFNAPRIRCASPILLLVLAATAAGAQQPATPGTSVPQASAAAQDNVAVEKKANDALLARAGKLYFTTGSVGLEEFDCTVHPDWHALFVSANKGATVADDDARIVLLKTVKITLHGRLKGGSSLDWIRAADPDKPLDQDSSTLLDSMHGATEQTLQGFMQFWTPFVDGSAMPANSDGLEMTKTDMGYTLHAVTKDTTVTEQMDKQLLLTHFDVILSQTTVNFEPAYKPTDQGLLVNGFVAHIVPAGAAPGQAQEMHVAIEYQDVDGAPIPAKLDMSVVGTGIFNFNFEGCQVSKSAK